MRATELIPNAPISIPKTVRNVKGRLLTSADAGKFLPLKSEWLHREDGIKNGRVRVNIAMEETAEMLQNGIAVTVYAHFVPHLAHEQFGGSLHEFNKSYQKKVGTAGSVIPFFETNKYLNTSTQAVTVGTPSSWDTLPQHGRGQFYQTMGIHFKGDKLNNTLVQSYNQVVNHMRKARSPSLPLRNQFDHTLAEAFWLNTSMENIVPDFDSSLIDGEVSLQGLTFQAPVKAPKYSRDHITGTASSNDTTTDTLGYSPAMSGAEIIDQGDMYLFDEIYAELTTGGNATMSLADIELARKTAGFAKIREKYNGLDDEIIDMLMSGIRMPETAMQQPILLAKQRAMISYNQRYATDGANLDKSATVGSATVDLNIRLPQMNCGGTLLICASIMPERLFERKKDHFLHMSDPDELPNALPDLLDPEQIRVIKNNEIDIEHATPDATFGYAPMNSQWKRDTANVGGKFYRPANDAYTEDRSRIWSVETLNPTLNETWYLCQGLHKKPFADQLGDSFEISLLSDINIVGNTQFGAPLTEGDGDDSDYEHITDQVQQARIVK